MKKENETTNNSKPMAYDTLLASVIHIRCNKCDIEYPDDEKCPKCGDYGGGVVFKSGDCTNCTYFMTDQLCYPSGKCKKHGFLTGIKKYCADFSAR